MDFFRIDMPDVIETDAGIIEQQKIIGKLGVISNTLLGDFGDDGVYVISANIVEELISMPKYLASVFEKQHLILSEWAIDEQFKFVLSIDAGQATFSLCEQMSFASNVAEVAPYSNMQITRLDTVDLTDDIADIVVFLYKKYNISAEAKVPKNYNDLSDDEKAKIFFIKDRKVMLATKQALYKQKQSEVDLAEKTLFEAILSALKEQSSPFSINTLNSFVKMVEATKKFIIPNTPGYYKAMNDILNAAILQNSLEEYSEYTKDLNKKVELMRMLYVHNIKDNIPALDKEKNIKDKVVVKTAPSLIKAEIKEKADEKKAEKKPEKKAEKKPEKKAEKKADKPAEAKKTPAKDGKKTDVKGKVEEKKDTNKESLIKPYVAPKTYDGTGNKQQQNNGSQKARVNSAKDRRANTDVLGSLGTDMGKYGLVTDVEEYGQDDDAVR